MADKRPKECDPEKLPKRVGQREVAKEAGVSLMTVSLAMRNSPSISVATREKVREAAERVGYRPDPEVARLMGKLRSSRVASRSVVIALIDLQTADLQHSYNQRLREGVETHLDRLGYGCTCFKLRDYSDDVSKIVRVIRERGIIGCILLPSDQPKKFSPKVNWDGISVVAATTSVLYPRFHRVGPNQVFNSMSVVEEMQRRGYKNIGAIFSESLERRQRHRYSIALAWYGHRERILLLPDGIDDAEESKLIKDWVATHRVDVLFVQNASMVMSALQARKFGSGARQVGLVSLGTLEDPKVSCLDELPEFVGESAVSLLVGMMFNSETGVPATPRSTVVDGVFREGGTVRSLPAKKG
ncbi:LacI family DNA-binding transcriptional regulator [Pelagicoccus enzymogenes]|uniref:LacI family DNA-binding transcriptional regulator n=1 Tax=Pelagicoccus enzymogenes TaxID=2773457 RepID=UPI00280EC803|nr:LacI family DNA-binding transcriptional regulator [Pelagicoccus enzymogenes]MDQ8201203.1 LacI family DNA-binding transcriptional regulator [Pelagicoccus enzymogenes]